MVPTRVAWTRLLDPRPQRVLTPTNRRSDWIINERRLPGLLPVGLPSAFDRGSVHTNKTVALSSDRLGLHCILPGRDIPRFIATRSTMHEMCCSDIDLNSEPRPAVGKARPFEIGLCQLASTLVGMTVLAFLGCVAREAQASLAVWGPRK